MRNETILDVQLEALKLDVDSFSVLQKMTRQQECHVMATAYVWWREAQLEIGYLDNCYKKYGISKNKIKGINFRPLIKLVSSSKLARNDLEIWAKALPVIHNDFEKYAADYAVNPVDRICHFIQIRGGKTGLTGYFGNKRDDEDEPLENVALFSLNDNEFMPTLLSEARKYYETKSQSAIQLPTLLLTDDGYSVVIVKKQANGYVLVGTTKEAALIDSALVSTYRSDFEALPLTMRVVLEPLHLLNAPSSLAKSYDKFIEASNLADAWDKKRRKEKAFKRLTYKSDEKEFLLSNMQTNSGVVVKAKPRSDVMGRQHGDLFLPNSTRQSVEVRLLHQAAFNLFKPSATDKFMHVGKEFVAANYVNLETKLVIEDLNGVTTQEIKQHTINLTHPPLSFIPFHSAFGVPRWQVTSKQEKITAKWQAQVDLDWLRTAVSTFFDKWIFAYGKKANRLVNKTLNVAFDAGSVVIAYEFDAKLGYDNTKIVALPQNASTGHVELTMRSADFAFVLRQIADLSIVGDLVMAADSGALVLKFETTASTYEVWIPSCDEIGERSSTHFEAYAAVASNQFTFHIAPEDDVPDMTAAELQLIKKNIKRVKNAKS